MPDQQMTSPLPKRVRNELRFRTIEVVSTQQIAGCFNRITFAGEALKGFNSAGFDDHIKLFFPVGGELNLPEITADGVVWQDGVRPASRDYTPLEFDGVNGRLTLDFYIHQQGVASDWALQAKPGDRLTIGGPRGSLVVPGRYAFQLYVCDETGLPAFYRRQQTLSGDDLRLFAFTDENIGKTYLGKSDVATRWLGRGAMTVAAAEALIAQFDNIALPPEDYFIWLTGEGAAVKVLSDYFIEKRQCEAERVRAVAYWHNKTSC